MTNPQPEPTPKPNPDSSPAQAAESSLEALEKLKALLGGIPFHGRVLEQFQTVSQDVVPLSPQILGEIVRQAIANATLEAKQYRTTPEHQQSPDDLESAIAVVDVQVGIAVYQYCLNHIVGEIINALHNTKARRELAELKTEHQ